MAKYYDVNIRETTAIFVSHNHINHAGDINAVISAMTHNGLDKKGVLVAANSVVAATEGTEPFLHSFYRECVEKVIIAEPEARIGINEVDILPTKTKHSDETGVGFKFLFERFTLGYVSDTEFSAEVADQFLNTDVLVLNVLYPRSSRIKGGMNTDDAIQFLKRTKPRLGVITHFGIKMLEADPLYEARELQKQALVQVIAAKDGMVIEPQSFSSSVRQKTLKSF